MQKKENFIIFLVFFIFLILNTIYAQVNIDIAKVRIALNEPFVIAIESIGEEIKNHSQFPEIQGFKKLNTTQRAEANDGGNIKKYIVIQKYYPTKKGSFYLPAFQMKINEYTKKTENYTIIVGSKDKNKPDLEDLEEEKITNVEQNVNAEAFLALNTNKDEIFVGEGVLVTLMFYVAKSNKAPMKLIELEKQLENIKKQLKPANAWEEKFDIDAIRYRNVFVNGREYSQGKIFEAIYFPLNKNNFYFPVLNIKVKAKTKITENEKENENFDNPTNTIEKFFSSSPKLIRIKELPPHPLKDRVAVGVFSLTEDYYTFKAQTGQNTKYYFRISGEGNLSAFSEPILNMPKGLEFYPPTLQQYIIRGEGNISGTVSFEYNVLPKQAGKYYFEDYFQWIYFNPQKIKYDTLKPKTTWEVIGINWQDKAISNAEKNFYMRINQENNYSLSDKLRNYWQMGVQILLGIMFVLVLILLFFKKKRNEKM